MKWHPWIVNLDLVVRKHGWRYAFASYLRIAHLKLWTQLRRLRFTHVGRGCTIAAGVRVEKDARSRVDLGRGCSIQTSAVFRSLAGVNNEPARISIGDQTIIKERAIVSVRSGVIEIGRNCALGRDCELVCENTELVIGNDVRMAAGVFVITDNHRFSRRDIPIRVQGREHSPVCIEDDVWLGRRVMVLAGVTIGRGVVGAAGAVITKDVAPYSIVGGVPAKVIGQRGEAGREIANSDMPVGNY